jgi:hypothetical protein
MILPGLDEELRAVVLALTRLNANHTRLLPPPLSSRFSPYISVAEVVGGSRPPVQPGVLRTMIFVLPMNPTAVGDRLAWSVYGDIVSWL